VVFGDPFEAVEGARDPDTGGGGRGAAGPVRCTRTVLDAATARIQEQLTAHLAYARRTTA
jgi:1-acyl-sn-glycerol-3-phosphate acyltransferase